MLNVKVDLESELPIYKQIVEFIKSEIRSGNIRSSYKLPTVRALADDIKISVGTAKHAYDILEHQGIIEMVQGKGTFVVDINKIENNMGIGYTSRASNLNKKERSQRLIDGFLNEMYKLSFSSKEIMMYLELQIREKEHTVKSAIIGIVDYDKQRLSFIATKIKTLGLGDIYKFFIDIDMKKIDNMMYNCDIILAPKDVYDDLLEDNNIKSKMLCLDVDTMLDDCHLDKLKNNTAIGLISSDKHFENGIKDITGHNEFNVTTFMNCDLEAFILENDITLVGQCFTSFATEKQIYTISGYIDSGKVIVCKYSIKDDIFNHITNKIKRGKNVY